MAKYLDLFVVSVLVIISSAITFVFNLKPLIGGVMLCLAPSFYMAWRKRKNWRKIILAVLIIGGIYGFVFDYAETFNRAWYVGRVVFEWRIGGVLPIDDVLGFLLMTLVTIVFYEHFIDDERDKKVSKNLWWSLTIPVLATAGLIILKFKIPYAYLSLGLGAVILPIVVGFAKPKLVPKILMTSIFFAFVWFIAEIVSLKTGAWIFAGEYIGTVSVFGVVFPFEELIFWMLMYAGSIVAYYELFVDDFR